MTWLAYSHLGVAKRLTLDTQPGGALAGIPFVSQPVGRLLDGSGVLSRTTGTVVTVSKLSGVGTLSGTLTAVTVEGVFTFTDLKMDTVTGTVILRFSAPGLVSVDSNSFNVTQPNTTIGCEVGTYTVTGTAQTLTRGPYMLRQDEVGSYAITGTTAALSFSGDVYANEPANYTTAYIDYGFDDDPSLGTGDHQIGSGWGLIYGDGTTSLEVDATAPVSPSNVFEWYYPTGLTTGTGVGNLYHTLPTGVSEFYIAFSIWHDSNFEWNTISNKLVIIEPGGIYFQTRHNATYWNFDIIGSGSLIYNPNMATGPDPTGQWVNIELQIKRGNPTGILRVWADGELITEYTDANISTSTTGQQLMIASTWGGATANKARDSYRRIDHIYVSHP